MSKRQVITTAKLGLLCTILLNETIDCIGQYCFKRASSSAGNFSFGSIHDILLMLQSFLVSGYFWGGLGAISLVFVVWCTVLAKHDLSIAMPLTSINYVLVALCSVLLLHEPVSFARWFGISFILVGVALVSSSDEEKRRPE